MAKVFLVIHLKNYFGDTRFMDLLYNCKCVLHLQFVIINWSCGIMDCVLFYIENRANALAVFYGVDSFITIDGQL